MNNALKDYRTYIDAAFIVTIIILALLLQCRGNHQPCTSTSDTTVITLTDTVPDRDTITKPQPYAVYRDTGSTKIVIADTGGALLACLEEKYYDLKLRDDTSMYVRVKAVVWGNNLDTVFTETRNRRPQQVYNITNTAIQERKFKLFVGASIGGSATSFEVAPGLLIQYGSFLFGANYCVFQKGIQVPLYWKIHGKDKKK